MTETTNLENIAGLIREHPFNQGDGSEEDLARDILLSLGVPPNDGAWIPSLTRVAETISFEKWERGEGGSGFKTRGRERTYEEIAEHLREEAEQAHRRSVRYGYALRAHEKMGPNQPQSWWRRALFGTEPSE